MEQDGGIGPEVITTKPEVIRQGPKPGMQWQDMDSPSDEKISIPDEVQNKIPHIHGLTEKQKAVIALSCAGFSNRAIGRCFNMTPTTVSNWLKKIDPENNFPVLSSRERRWMLALIVESKIGDALLRITHHKMDKLDAVKLIDFVNKSLTAMQSLGVKEEAPVETAESLVSKLAK